MGAAGFDDPPNVRAGSSGYPLLKYKPALISFDFTKFKSCVIRCSATFLDTLFVFRI